MNHRTKTVICVILFLPVWFVLYAFLHEAGHALVGLAYGGTINNFVFWNINAHVSISKAEFTVFGASLMNSAGMLLPTITGAIAIVFYKPHIKFPGYHFCFSLGSISLIFSMLTWVVIPVISLFTSMPGEDVTNFLGVSGIHPLLVSFGALLLVGAFILLAYKKGVLKKAQELYRSLQNYRKAHRRRALISAVLGLLVAATAVYYVANNADFLGNRNRGPIVFSISFPAESLLTQEEDWYLSFDIEDTREYSLELDMNARGFITALRITDEDGKLIYQTLGEATRGTTTLLLESGSYTLSVTYLADFEAVANFLRSTEQGEMSSADVSFYTDVFSHSEIDDSTVFSITLLKN